jgi:hypothetical protein
MDVAREFERALDKAGDVSRAGYRVGSYVGFAPATLLAAFAVGGFIDRDAEAGFSALAGAAAFAAAGVFFRFLTSLRGAPSPSECSSAKALSASPARDQSNREA